MSTFDPFDKKAASASAARDREMAERAKKMQAEADARRKKQLLQADIAKIQQEIARRKQEELALSQDTERIVRLVEQKKKEELEAMRNLQGINRKVVDEEKRLGVIAGIINGVTTKIQNLVAQLSVLVAKEKQEESATGNKRILLTNASQKKEMLAGALGRLEGEVKKLEGEVDVSKKTLVQRQTDLANKNRKRSDLEKNIEVMKQKIHDLEHELQLLKSSLFKAEQEKTGIDGEYVQENEAVKRMAQKVQEKESDLYTRSQEQEKVRRELAQEKDILERTRGALTQDEGIERRDEVAIRKIEEEKEALAREQKIKLDEQKAVQGQYQGDAQLKKTLEEKAAGARSFIATQSVVLGQKQQRHRVVSEELEKLEVQLQQKERELQGIRI